jgi:hypothetical protein
VEYVLTTTREGSTSAGHTFRETFGQTLSDILSQGQRLAPDVRPFLDLILRSPIATAVVAGLLVLFVGLLLTRRD